MLLIEVSQSGGQSLELGILVEHPLVVLAIHIVELLGLISQAVGFLGLYPLVELIVVAVAHKDGPGRDLGQKVLHIEADEALADGGGHGGGGTPHRCPHLRSSGCRH